MPYLVLEIEGHETTSKTIVIYKQLKSYQN